MPSREAACRQEQCRGLTMDRGQARIRRQRRDHAIVATTRVSASVGGISVATGSPSQADFFKTGQVDRLHQDGSGGRGRVGRRLRTVTSRQACEHRWYARRSEAVACDSGSCGRKRCRRRMRHAIVATTSVRRCWFLCIQICVYLVRYLFRYVKVVF